MDAFKVDKIFIRVNRKTFMTTVRHFENSD